MGVCCCMSDRVDVADDKFQEPTPGKQHSPSPSAGSFVGPVTSRRCQDVFWLLVFIVFIIVLAVLYAYSGYHGDLERILFGADNCGNTCGVNNKPLTNIPCSGKDMRTKKFLVLQLKLQSQNVDRQCELKCPDKSNKLLRRCIDPQLVNASDWLLSRTGLAGFFREAAEDLELCWREILYMALIAFVIAIILVILLRFVAAFLIYFVLIGVVIASVATTVYLWITWHQRRRQVRSMANPTEGEQRSVTNLMAYAIFSTVIMVIIVLVILVMRKRIKLVIQLFKEAGKAVQSMPLLLLQPFWTFIALALLITAWISGVLLIESAGFPKKNDKDDVYFMKDSTIVATRWYNLFALFWFTQFCVGCQHVVIGGAVSIWFFTRKKTKLGSPILTSIGWLIKYHLGSVALGSLVVAVVQMVRAVLAFVERQLKGKEGNTWKCLLRCCQCCLACFERYIKFLNRNAYIEIAIYGDSFCTSAIKAFKILTANALRVMAINSVGDFVLLLAKAAVVICTVVSGVEMLKAKPGMQHMWVPLLVAGLFAYCIAHCFISVYEMAIDTIFICFCEDCEHNDGLMRPYYMSRGLMEFVQNSRKALSADSGRGTPNQAWGGAQPGAFSVERGSSPVK